MIALRWRKHRQKRQGPDPLGPRNRSQQHHGYPAQPTGFYKEFLARSHRITIDPSCRNLLSSTPLNRFIDPDDNWVVCWNKQVDKQQQQQTADLSTRPFRSMKHTMVILELFLM